MKPGGLRQVLERLVDALAIVAFTGVFACVLGQVVFRYVLGSPLTWSEELGRYLFVWCAFLGWIVAARRGSHLAMGFLRERLPARGAASLDVAFSLATIAFSFVLVRYGTLLAAANWDVPTVTLPVSIGFVYAIVPAVGVALVAYAVGAMRVAWRSLRRSRRA